VSHTWTGSTNNEAQLRASNITDYIKTSQRWALLCEGESAADLLDDSYWSGALCFRSKRALATTANSQYHAGQVGCFNGSTMKFIVPAAVFLLMVS